MNLIDCEFEIMDFLEDLENESSINSKEYYSMIYKELGGETLWNNIKF